MSGDSISEDALVRVAALLAERVGLRVEPAMRGRLARAVTDEAGSLGLDVADYVTRVQVSEVLLQELLNRVTVQETAFFRDPGQFAALAERVLPTLTPPVRVWSAGCANGQEAASLAIALTESVGPDWRVTATDVSTRALARTRLGRYSAREMVGLSDQRRAAHFVRVGAEWDLDPGLRSRIDVLHHNLVAEPPPFPPGGCDVVFCRNVLIYLRPENVSAFVERLAKWLAPDAWLFLGYSESLWQVTDKFDLVRAGDSFVYRRRADDPRVEPVAPNVDRGDGSRPASTAPIAPAPAIEPVPVDHSGPALTAAGVAAMNAGDHAAAIAAFRRCTYLNADDPIAHLHLGLAMESAGDASGARRSYGAARRALERSGAAAVEADLGGYAIGELRQLLNEKVELGR